MLKCTKLSVDRVVEGEENFIIISNLFCTKLSVDRVEEGEEDFIIINTDMEKNLMITIFINA